MKKKIAVIILLFFIIIDAKAYECYYDWKVEIGVLKVKYEYQFNFIINEDTSTIEYPSAYYGDAVVNIDSIIDSNLNDVSIVKSLNGSCPSVVIGCYMDGIYGFFLDENNYENLQWQTVLGATYAFVGNYSISEDYCAISEYNKDKSTRGAGDSSFTCAKFDEIYKSMKNSFCDNNLNKCDLSEYNKRKDELKSFCNSTLQLGNYSLNPCVKSCVDMANVINDIENVKSKNTHVCGLSQKIILWIANIVKWAKYILPVIIIVLSMLDFIKSIGVDKEDEMKKAQKHFVIRLICAALIFILPFIIEFVLNKMGFSANECGILDF